MEDPRRGKFNKVQLVYPYRETKFLLVMNDSIRRRKGQLINFELIEGNWTLRPEKVILRDYVLGSFSYLGSLVIVMPEAFSRYNDELEHLTDYAVSDIQVGVSVVALATSDLPPRTVLAKIHSKQQVEEMEIDNSYDGGVEDGESFLLIELSMRMLKEESMILRRLLPRSDIDS